MMFDWQTTVSRKSMIGQLHVQEYEIEQKLPTSTHRSAIKSRYMDVRFNLEVQRRLFYRCAFFELVELMCCV
jgi:hypothetical protein